MKFDMMLHVAPWLLALSTPVSVSAFHLQLQDSPSSQSQELSKKSGGQESQPANPSPDEQKKAKKVWTNDNLNEVSGSAISQVGKEKNRPADKGTAAMAPSSQTVAAF